MRVLAICQAGTVRSGALVIEAKLAGHDAIGAGVDFNAPETIAMLSSWADVILVAEARFAAAVPETQRHKVTDAALGLDVWHSPVHPELRERAAAIVRLL